MDSYQLLKYLKGSCSPKEEAEIQHWLADDPDGSHKETYRQMHNIYNGMTLYGGSSRKEARPVSWWRRFAVWSGAAAAAAALFAGVLVHQHHATIDRLAAQTEIIRVPQGQSLQLDLEDGTKIWLNGGTEIERPAVFGRKDRRLTVRHGEVLLDVVKDEKHPFYVETFASTVKVLGTRFDVEVDETAGEFAVTLLRGRVVAQGKDSRETVALQPDERLALENGRLAKSRVTNRSAVDCWTEGLIDVSGIPFDALMRKFEKAFDVRIVLDRDEIPTISYTRGKIRISDGIEHALDVLQVAADFTYERDFDSNTIIIK